ncbi:MAG TPA: hypothetical protein VF519_10190 [Mycobacteriales bacterium]|jgi:hypothetical protein
MATTTRLAGSVAVAAALLAPLAPAAADAASTITVGIENGCEPVTGACTIVQGDWGVKIVRGDPYCPSPSPSGSGTGLYVGHGSWDWIACLT